MTEVLQRANRLGFLGPMAPGDQIDHSLGFVLVVEGERSGVPVSVLDLGAGGGVPGLVIGACWPECRLSLVDASRRRTEFLQREILRLPRPGRVDVLHGRAEDLARDPELRERFEVVTARSFGPPAVTAECGSPFLVRGGMLVVSEPPGRGDPGRWPLEGLANLGLEDGGPARSGGLHYRVLRKANPSPDRFPRRIGIPAKRPLF